MQAYQLQSFGAPMQVVEHDAAAPTGTEVAVLVSHCGICHTDLHLCEGFYSTGGGTRITLAQRGLQPPMTLGHEIAGTLSEIGPDAPIGQNQLGRQFIIYPWIGCGTCLACAAGLDNHCSAARPLGMHRPGGYQQRVIVPHPRYLFDASGLDPAVAATLGCSGLSAFSALKKLPTREGALLIIGLGGLGQNMLGLARAQGRNHIITADIDAGRREQALQHGASLAVDPGDADASQLIGSLDVPLIGVIDCVGSDETAAWAIGMLQKGGCYVAIGLFGGALNLSVPLLIMKALTVVGSFAGSPAELGELLELLRSTPARLPDIEPVAWPELNSALDRLAAGGVNGRLVLAVDQTPSLHTA